jgi:hypothetical protein
MSFSSMHDTTKEMHHKPKSAIVTAVHLLSHVAFRPPSRVATRPEPHARSDPTAMKAVTVTVGTIEFT